MGLHKPRQRQPSDRESAYLAKAALFLLALALPAVLVAGGALAAWVGVAPFLVAATIAANDPGDDTSTRAQRLSTQLASAFGIDPDAQSVAQWVFESRGPSERGGDRGRGPAAGGATAELHAMAFIAALVGRGGRETIMLLIGSAPLGLGLLGDWLILLFALPVVALMVDETRQGQGAPLRGPQVSRQERVEQLRQLLEQLAMHGVTDDQLERIRKGYEQRWGGFSPARWGSIRKRIMPQGPNQLELGFLVGLSKAMIQEYLKESPALAALYQKKPSRRTVGVDLELLSRLLALDRFDSEVWEEVERELVAQGRVDDIPLVRAVFKRLGPTHLRLDLEEIGLVWNVTGERIGQLKKQVVEVAEFWIEHSWWDEARMAQRYGEAVARHRELLILLVNQVARERAIPLTAKGLPSARVVVLPREVATAFWFQTVSYGSYRWDDLGFLRFLQQRVMSNEDRYRRRREVRAAPEQVVIELLKKAVERFELTREGVRKSTAPGRRAQLGQITAWLKWARPRLDVLQSHPDDLREILQHAQRAFTPEGLLRHDADLLINGQSIRHGPLRDSLPDLEKFADRIALILPPSDQAPAPASPAKPPAAVWGVLGGFEWLHGLGGWALSFTPFVGHSWQMLMAASPLWLAGLLGGMGLVLSIQSDVEIERRRLRLIGRGVFPTDQVLKRTSRVSLDALEGSAWQRWLAQEKMRQMASVRAFAIELDQRLRPLLLNLRQHMQALSASGDPASALMALRQIDTVIQRARRGSERRVSQARSTRALLRLVVPDLASDLLVLASQFPPRDVEGFVALLERLADAVERPLNAFRSMEDWRILEVMGDRAHRYRIEPIRRMVAPLSQLSPETIRHILIVVEAPISRRGGQTVSLFPLVVGLRRRFPEAVIHVSSTIPELFNTESLQGIIRPVPEVLARPLSWGQPPAAHTAAAQFLSANPVDLLIAIGFREGFFTPAWVALPSDARPHLVEFQGVAQTGFGMEHGAVAPVRYRDRQDHQYEVAAPDGSPGEASLSDGMSSPLFWEIAIRFARLLGLDVEGATLPVLRVTETERELTRQALRTWYAAGLPSSPFDPNRRLLVLNLVAGTFNNLLTAEEWRRLITRLVRALPQTYVVVPHGGPSDPWYATIMRIVESVKRQEGIDPTTLIVPMVNVYPFLHGLLGLADVLTVDTYLAHHASLYGLRHLGIITPHRDWLPPRESVVPLLVPPTGTPRRWLALERGLDEFLARVTAPTSDEVGRDVRAHATSFLAVDAGWLSGFLPLLLTDPMGWLSSLLLVLTGTWLGAGPLLAAFAPLVIGMVESAHAPEESVKAERLFLKDVLGEVERRPNGPLALVLAHTMDEVVADSSVTPDAQRAANERRWEALIQAVLTHLGLDAVYVIHLLADIGAVDLTGRTRALSIEHSSGPSHWLNHIEPGEALVVRRREPRAFGDQRQQLISGILMKQVLQRHARQRYEEDTRSDEQRRAFLAHLDVYHASSFIILFGYVVSESRDITANQLAERLRLRGLNPEGFNLPGIIQDIRQLEVIRQWLRRLEPRLRLEEQARRSIDPLREEIAEVSSGRSPLAGITTEELVAHWKHDHPSWSGDADTLRSLLATAAGVSRNVRSVSLEEHSREVQRVARQYAREHPSVAFIIWEVFDDASPPHPLLLVVQKQPPQASSGESLFLLAPLMWSSALSGFLELGMALLSLVGALVLHTTTHTGGKSGATLGEWVRGKKVPGTFRAGGSTRRVSIEISPREISKSGQSAGAGWGNGRMFFDLKAERDVYEEAGKRVSAALRRWSIASTFFSRRSIALVLASMAFVWLSSVFVWPSTVLFSVSIARVLAATSFASVWTMGSSLPSLLSISSIASFIEPDSERRAPTSSATTRNVLSRDFRRTFVRRASSWFVGRVRDFLGRRMSPIVSGHDASVKRFLYVSMAQASQTPAEGTGAGAYPAETLSSLQPERTPSTFLPPSTLFVLLLALPLVGGGIGGLSFISGLASLPLVLGQIDSSDAGSAGNEPEQGEDPERLASMMELRDWIRLSPVAVKGFEEITGASLAGEGPLEEKAFQRLHVLFGQEGLVHLGEEKRVALWILEAGLLVLANLRLNPEAREQLKVLSGGVDFPEQGPLNEKQLPLLIHLILDSRGYPRLGMGGYLNDIEGAVHIVHSLGRLSDKALEYLQQFGTLEERLDEFENRFMYTDGRLKEDTEFDHPPHRESGIRKGPLEEPQWVMVAFTQDSMTNDIKIWVPITELSQAVDALNKVLPKQEHLTWEHSTVWVNGVIRTDPHTPIQEGAFIAIQGRFKAQETFGVILAGLLAAAPLAWAAAHPGGALVIVLTMLTALGGIFYAGSLASAASRRFSMRARAWVWWSSVVLMASMSLVFFWTAGFTTFMSSVSDSTVFASRWTAGLSIPMSSVSESMALSNFTNLGWISATLSAMVEIFWPWASSSALTSFHLIGSGIWDMVVYAANFVSTRAGSFFSSDTRSLLISLNSAFTVSTSWLLGMLNLSMTSGRVAGRASDALRGFLAGLRGRGMYSSSWLAGLREGFTVYTQQNAVKRDSRRRFVRRMSPIVSGHGASVKRFLPWAGVSVAALLFIGWLLGGVGVEGLWGLPVGLMVERAGGGRIDRDSSAPAAPTQQEIEDELRALSALWHAVREGRARTDRTSRSQSAVARSMGVPPSTVSRLEGYKQGDGPGIFMLAAFARTVNVPLPLLLDRANLEPERLEALLREAAATTEEFTAQPNLADFPQRLDEIRRRLGLAWPEVAARSGVSLSTLDMLRADLGSPTAPNFASALFIRLRKGVGVDFEELFGSPTMAQGDPRGRMIRLSEEEQRLQAALEKGGESSLMIGAFHHLDDTTQRILQYRLGLEPPAPGSSKFSRTPRGPLSDAVIAQQSDMRLNE
ncbi:MAG: hypothetical protein HYZ91_05410, partial [Candidatus Omnitrophica bacterium]|nr:hypothetical protein [Candidatus Omnitrophota bacterium]